MYIYMYHRRLKSMTAVSHARDLELGSTRCNFCKYCMSLPLYIFFPSSPLPFPSLPFLIYVLITHKTMYLTAITTACCYCNFSLHFKQRLHRGGGVRLRWTHMDGEQLHCGSPHIKLESFVLAASRE